MDSGAVDQTCIRIVVPGAPKGKGRPRTAVRGGHAVIYTPKATASEEGAIRMFASQAMKGAPPLESPLECRIWAYMPVPQSWSGRKQTKAMAGDIFPVGKPDFDNIAKIACDSMNKIVFRDDAQIVTFTFWKRYSAVPQLVIEIRPVVVETES